MELWGTIILFRASPEARLGILNETNELQTKIKHPMKNLINGISTCLLAVGAMAALAGCKTVEGEALGGNATVTIEKAGAPDYTSFEVNFFPSSDAVSFRYAIGEVADYDAFRDGTMEGIVSVEGNEAKNEVFTDLIPDKIYTVYAVAMDASGKEGEVATVKIPTADDGFLVESQYVSDSAAGFTFTVSSDYRGGRYWLGKEGDKEKFESGEVGTDFSDMSSHTANFFDLESGADYVFFFQSLDRAGMYSTVMQMDITTKAAGSCAKADLTYTNDIYRGVYTLTPNSNCSKITAFVANKGANDEMINSGAHWCGNIVAMMTSWEDLADYGYVTIATGGKPCEIEYLTPELKCDNELEVFVMVYNNEGKVDGLQYYVVKTPSFDSNAGTAKMSVEVSEITTTGATYTYTKGENTFAFMYDSVDADWWDDFKENDPAYEEYYLHNLLFQSGKYWSYGQDVTTFKEETATPGMRLYAAGCPMNVNGPEGGWGELVLSEYTTLTE